MILHFLNFKELCWFSHVILNNYLFLLMKLILDMLLENDQKFVLY